METFMGGNYRSYNSLPTRWETQLNGNAGTDSSGSAGASASHSLGNTVEWKLEEAGQRICLWAILFPLAGKHS